MKKIIALLLALLLAFGMTACSNGEAEATAAATGFLDAFVALDFDTASTYLDDPEFLTDMAAALDMESILGDLGDAEGFTEEIQGIIDTLMGKVKENMAYEMVGVEASGDNFVVTANVTTPRFEEDLETLLGDQLSDEIIETILMEALAAGTISLDATEEELMAVLLPLVLEKVNEAIANLELATTTEQYVLVVTEKDGKWVIVTDESSMNN